MDHGGMNHDHGGMDHSTSMKCSMNMLWNSQVGDVCVVFEKWHIQTWWGMTLSCVIVALLSFLYLHLLHLSQQQDKRTAIQLYLGNKADGNGRGTVSLSSSGPGDGEIAQSLVRGESPMPNGRGGNLGIVKLPSSVRLSRAVLYASTMALSFFLMLVAMTYNTYLFFSIILGGFLGHLTYESEMDVAAVLSGQQAKGYACH